MTQSQTTPGRAYFRAMPRSLPTLEVARSSVSFPLRVPAFLPDGFRLDAIKVYWPDFIPETARTQSGPHADFLQLRYVDTGGHWMEITQGYMPMYFGWHEIAPADSRGTVAVQGTQAIWVIGKPSPGVVQMVGGKPQVSGWERGQTAVAWLAGVDGDSHRYYGVASDLLTLEQIVAIANSVTSY